MLLSWPGRFNRTYASNEILGITDETARYAFSRPYGTGVCVWLMVITHLALPAVPTGLGYVMLPTQQ